MSLSPDNLNRLAFAAPVRTDFALFYLREATGGVVADQGADHPACWSTRSSASDSNGRDFNHEVRPS